MARLGNIVHTLEHQEGDGEEEGIVDVVFGGLPFRRASGRQCLSRFGCKSIVERFDVEEGVEHGPGTRSVIIRISPLDVKWF